MQKLNIGIPDLDKFNPRRGIGRSVTSLASYWRQWGHELVNLPSRQTQWPVFRNLKWGVRGPLNGIDVVFVPDILDNVILPYFLPPNLPCVLMIYDVGVLDCPEDRSEATLLTRPVFQIALKAARHSTRVISVSDFTADRLLHFAPFLKGKIRIANLGVDHAIFSPRERFEARKQAAYQGINFTKDDFIVIYVGDEYPRKNLSKLIEAFAILKRDIPMAKFIKVGRSYNQRDRIRTIAKINEHGLSLGGDFIILEGVDDKLLALLYSCSNVFATTSKYEGFVLPLLEALACGLPAVVGQVASLFEVSGDAATYVDPDDPAAFANEISKVRFMDNKFWESKAIERSMMFSWEKTALDVLNVLQEATNLEREKIK